MKLDFHRICQELSGLDAVVDWVSLSCLPSFTPRVFQLPSVLTLAPRAGSPIFGPTRDAGRCRRMPADARDAQDGGGQSPIDKRLDAGRRVLRLMFFSFLFFIFHLLLLLLLLSCCGTLLLLAMVQNITCEQKHI